MDLYNIFNNYEHGLKFSLLVVTELLWRHNGRGSVSNHQPRDCLPNHSFRRRSKKTSKIRVTGLCVGKSPGTGEFPAQMASNVENVSIWRRHYVGMDGSYTQPVCVTGTGTNYSEESFTAITSANQIPRYTFEYVYILETSSAKPLQWRHDELDGVSGHQPPDCLLKLLFRRSSKKTSKLRVTGLCVGNSPVTGECSAQMVSNTENISIWWRHHVNLFCEIWQSSGSRPICAMYCVHVGIEFTPKGNELSPSGVARIRTQASQEPKLDQMPTHKPIELSGLKLNRTGHPILMISEDSTD